MKKLQDDWITSGTLDFEYKKYILLAYLQHVQDSFEAYKLYPSFSDLILHYRNASALKKNKLKLLNSFPKAIKAIDLKKFKLFFEAVVEDDHASKELEEILDFALSEMKSKLSIGKHIFDEIERQLEIELVGLSALNHNEGLLVLNPDYDSHYHIFQYKLSFFETAHEKVKALHMHFIDKVRKTVFNTVEQVKLQFIKNLGLHGNFTTYHIVSVNNHVPLEESLLPVVKRSFSSYLDSIGNSRI